MPDSKTKIAADRKRINVHEDHELRYRSEKFNVSHHQLRRTGYAGHSPSGPSAQIVCEPDTIYRMVGGTTFGKEIAAVVSCDAIYSPNDIDIIDIFMILLDLLLTKRLLSLARAAPLQPNPFRLRGRARIADIADCYQLKSWRQIMPPQSDNL